jgi:hypothetical protein
MSLSLTACGGKSKSGDSTTPPENTAEAPAPTAALRTFATDAEYDTTATEMTTKMIGIFEAGGKDCDKLAASFTAFGNENRATLDALRTYEQSHPDARKAFEEKMKAREDEMAQKLTPSMEACMNHEGLHKAMQGAGA